METENLNIIAGALRNVANDIQGSSRPLLDEQLDLLNKELRKIEAERKEAPAAIHLPPKATRTRRWEKKAAKK